MLETSKWKIFKFDKVFKFERGKRLISVNQTEGDIPYISSTKKNNGIDNYINPPNYMTIYENVLTLNNSGSVGYCFYHPYKIVCSDHCTIISIRDENIMLNPHIALFLRTLIESMKYKYNFAREINNDRLSKENIILPANQEGEPDWQFMEDYMKDISQKVYFKNSIFVIRKNSQVKIDTSKWKWFSISKIFNIEKGERLVKHERIEGVIPLITASSKENGIVDFLSEDIFENKKKIFENKITIDMFFDVFYHSYRYFSDDNVHTLIPKFNKSNLYVMLFILTILKESSYKYAYGRQLRIKRLGLERIKLPTDKDGSPDWNFMESYVKSLPYSKNLEN